MILKLSFFLVVVIIIIIIAIIKAAVNIPPVLSTLRAVFPKLCCLEHSLGTPSVAK